ncbi:MAG: ATP-binding protein [Deltaproteobacteria bacterium]|nr:ATP-binding protein [Deltaproteobacteria bacterium]
MLIGRERELRSLRTHLARAANATGQAVLLAGVPGAGKTSIARAFVEELRPQGARVSWARSGDSARSPWWLWRQVLDGFGAEAAPVLSALDAHGRGDDHARRFSVFSNVIRFLRERAAEAPLLVVLRQGHLHVLRNFLTRALPARTSVARGLSCLRVASPPT